MSDASLAHHVVVFSHRFFAVRSKRARRWSARSAVGCRPSSQRSVQGSGREPGKAREPMRCECALSARSVRAGDSNFQKFVAILIVNARYCRNSQPI
jgi:hypothetical protein